MDMRMEVGAITGSLDHGHCSWYELIACACMIQKTQELDINDLILTSIVIRLERYDLRERFSHL